MNLLIFRYQMIQQGRRFSFFLFLTCECLLGTLTALAPNVGCFALLRFLLGLTVPASVATPAALAQEFVGIKWRGRNLHLTYLYRSLGGVLLAGSVFVIRDWPHIALASTVPFIAFFLYWWRSRLPDWLRWRAIGCIEMGMSQADAARRLNDSRSVVHLLWSQFESEDSVSGRHVPGRSRVTKHAGDRYLALSARRKSKHYCASAHGRSFSGNRNKNLSCYNAQKPAQYTPVCC
ncbi:Organic cation transporter 1, partial [Stegodyphus mimosarum]